MIRAAGLSRTQFGNKEYADRFDPSKTYIGVIKENVDKTRMGSLRVWIKGSTSDPNDPSGWVTVRYCSPFAGATTLQQGQDPKSYLGTQKSYGFWAVPPDLENEVLVVFANGETAQGYWIGCIYQYNMNNMIPGIPSANTYQGNGLPGSEYNKDTQQTRGTQGFIPYYEPLALGLKKQGLIDTNRNIIDEVRGPGTSGARREETSRVIGLLSPGGNEIVLDDGVDNELIRFRTKSGAQILISETHGMIYIISRDGNSWFELSNDGHVDLFGFNDISIRSQSNLNIRADKSINIEADEINIKSLTKSINLDSGNNLNLYITNAGFIEAVSLDSKVGTNKITSSSYQLKTNSYVAEAEDLSEKVNGLLERWANSAKKITPPIEDAGTEESGDMPVPSQAASAAYPITQNKTDKSFDSSTEAWINTNTTTILNRLPQHEPWSDHGIASTGTRDLVQEQDKTPAKKGSIEKNTSNPLPVIGSPQPNMAPGIYIPKDYTSKGEPTYEYVAPSTELASPKTLKISNRGLALIQEYEGFRSQIYNDLGGFPTVGYGHKLSKLEITNASYQTGIDFSQGQSLLRNDVRIAEQCIYKNVTANITQNQFDVLCSFIYNVGIGNFARSTLLSRINQGRLSEVPNELMRWNKVQGKEIAGLTRRRRAEALLFTSSEDV